MSRKHACAHAHLDVPACQVASRRLEHELVAKGRAGRRQLVLHINLAAVLQLHLIPAQAHARMKIICT